MSHGELGQATAIRMLLRDVRDKPRRAWAGPAARADGCSGMGAERGSSELSAGPACGASASTANAHQAATASMRDRHGGWSGEQAANTEGGTSSGLPARRTARANTEGGTTSGPPARRAQGSAKSRLPARREA
jgi:hypothetical protein